MRERGQFFKPTYLPHEIATRLQGPVVKKVNGRPTADERAIHFQRGQEEGVEEGGENEGFLERDKKSIKIEPLHPTWRMRYQDRVGAREGAREGDRERGGREREREGGRRRRTIPLSEETPPRDSRAKRFDYIARKDSCSLVPGD